MSEILSTVNSWIGGFNDNIGQYLLMALLVPTGLFFTISFGFLQIRKFRHSIDIVRGKFDNPDDPGDVSHFQALTTALSATVGTGNIAGVALAVAWGGPGAVFWMWVTGFLGMMNKFAECTLGLKYREILADGTVSGGPMYYMEKGLKRFFGRVPAKTLGIFFAAGAIMASFGTGNMAQSNSVAEAMKHSYGFSDWVTGLVLASLVFAVIIGGIKRIAQVTSRLVPFMATFYVLGALIVILVHLDEVLPMLGFIVESAFTGTAAVGGFAGSTFLMTMRWGIARGLFSNEAGQGSAAIAHSAAKTEYPVREGLVALMEPFIDTLMICTMTALVLLISGAWSSGDHQSTAMTAYAFQTGLEAAKLGFIGEHIVTIGIFLFALSTAISWSYYGDRAVTYLFGSRYVIFYRVVYCVVHFAGAVFTVKLVWNFADMVLIWMTIPNLLALLLLSPELRRDTRAYFSAKHEFYTKKN